MSQIVLLLGVPDIAIILSQEVEAFCLGSLRFILGRVTFSNALVRALLAFLNAVNSSIQSIE